MFLKTGVRVFFAVCAVGIFMQCDDGNPTDDDTLGDNNQSGIITITTGDAVGCVTRRPDFTWDGTGVMSLSVTDSSGILLYWKLESVANTDDILSPVTQGTAPAGTIEIDSTGDVDKKLPKEKWLKVTLYRANGDSGSAWFVPTGGCN